MESLFICICLLKVDIKITEELLQTIFFFFQKWQNYIKKYRTGSMLKTNFTSLSKELNFHTLSAQEDKSTWGETFLIGKVVQLIRKSDNWESKVLTSRVSGLWVDQRICLASNNFTYVQKKEERGRFIDWLFTLLLINVRTIKSLILYKQQQ